ncbi:hypothetical protein BJ875DRAFT_217223 [Amylocarpus encephaloides]|uniref:Uncharacterized protein n=1 Tax=Amylocarpus encephaloides TaxID=45428 RepID=A0A9P7YMZ6_9HELO|nr:hypothetical protein BJ875DRAFT_217223 [Amylocarpus encephaloides]
MATWGAYFSSYVKKREDGTLFAVLENPDTKKAEESQLMEGITMRVQRPNTAPKKLYGATIEEPFAPQIQRSASNAARVANLFGYAQPKPTLTQVVEDSEATDSGVTAKPSPIVAQVAEKALFVPITSKPAGVKPVEEAKVEVAAVTKSLFKPWSFAKTVQTAVKVQAEKNAEEVDVGPKNENTEPAPVALADVKRTAQPEIVPKSEPTEFATWNTTVPAANKCEEVKIQPKTTAPLHPISLDTVVQSLQTDFPQPSRTVTTPQVSTNYLVSSKPVHARKATLDDVMQDLYDMPSQPPQPSQTTAPPPQPPVASQPTTEEEAPKRSITRSATKNSLDDVMMALQSMPTEVKAKSPTRPTQRSRGAPKQSISDSLDDIMLALQGDIVPAKARLVPAPVSVEKAMAKSSLMPEKLALIPASPMAFEAKTADLPPLTTRLSITEQTLQNSASPISRQSSSTTRSRMSFTSSILSTQPETPDSEVEPVEFVESRAWQHARRISEFKLQQERMEEERKKMLEDRLKFQRDEARFQEEEEQQRMFVEIVREEQEREEKEEAERRRVAEEERIRLEEIAWKQEEERQRVLVEERRFAGGLARGEEEERQRAAEERTKVKEWEEEKARNAAEVAMLIREEEEREEREMQELKRETMRVEEESQLIKDDDISVYSDELVESDDDDEEERQEDPRQEYQKDVEEARLLQLRYEEEEEDRMRFEIEEEERERREDEAERVRFEEQAGQRRRIQEKKDQAERQNIEEQEEYERRQIEERKEQRLRFKKEEVERSRFEEETERERYAKREAERQQIEEERRIEEIAARMQAEDEAAEAEEEKQRELAKAEEKIRAAFAGMAKERGQEPPVVPKLQRPTGDNGISLLRRAQTDLRDGSKPTPTTPGGNGVSRYNTVGGAAGPRQMNKPLPSPAGVSRGNTTGMKPPGGPRGLPNGPRAGLPSGPRPRGRS